MMVLVLIGSLHDLVGVHWLSVIFNALYDILVLYLMVYLYLAMPGFYRQGKWKTFIKFLLVNLLALVVNAVLALLFLVISAILV